MPFPRRRQTAVAGDKIVGEDGQQPLPGGVDDPAAHHPRGVAAKAHGHGEGLLAAGAAPLEGPIQVVGDPGQVARILQQGEQGEEDGHGRKHHADHPGQHPVDPQHQRPVEPFRGSQPDEELAKPILHPK